MKRSGAVAKACLQIPTGHGFESQVPICLVIFSIHVIQCRFRLRAYHTPSNIKALDGPRPDLVIQVECPPWG